MKTKGTVKWFNDRKGLDLSDSMAETMFVHYSALQGEGFKTLKRVRTSSLTSFRVPKVPRRRTC